MLDNQNIENGKMKIDGLTNKYLESNGFYVVIDPEGSISFDGINIPTTVDELNKSYLEFFFKEILETSEKEVMELSNSTVEVMVRPTPKLVRDQFIDAIEQEQPEPVIVVEPQPEPQPEQEGFLTSYYNWIFGAPTPKKEEEKLVIAPPKPMPKP